MRFLTALLTRLGILAPPEEDKWYSDADIRLDELAAQVMREKAAKATRRAVDAAQRNEERHKGL